MKQQLKKIGFTTKSHSSPQLNAVCDVVITLPHSQTEESFYQLVKKYQAYELYMDDVSELNLRLGELAKGLTYLNQHQQIIHYLTKDNLTKLSDQTYFKLLVELAQNEKETAKPLLSLNVLWGVTTK